MRDVRCLLGRHRWQRRRVEDSVFWECTRCHTDRAGYGVPPGVTLFGP